MPDTEQTDLTDQADLESLTDTYVERRTLTPNDPYTAKVEEINVDDSGKHPIIELFLSAGGHLFVTSLWVKEDLYINGPSLEFLSNIDLEQGQFDPREDVIEQLADSYLNLCFDEDLSHCWAPDADMDMRLEPVSESVIPSDPNHELDEQVQDRLETLVICRSRYKEQLESQHAWELEITEINPLSEDEFELRASDSAIEQELVWEISLPDTTDPEHYDSARLIEHVGEGLPNQMEGEAVYAVNHTDIHPTDIDTIKKDTTETWYLITPQDYRDWKEENVNQRNSLIASAMSLF